MTHRDGFHHGDREEIEQHALQKAGEYIAVEIKRLYGQWKTHAGGAYFAWRKDTQKRHELGVLKPDMDKQDIEKITIEVVAKKLMIALRSIDNDTADQVHDQCGVVFLGFN